MKIDLQLSEPDNPGINFSPKRAANTVSPGETLARLISPFGVVSSLRAIPARRGLPELSRASALTGRHGYRGGPAAVGSGLALGNASHARTVAVAEAAERYAGGDSERHPSEFMHSSANELCLPAIDVDRIPQCSPREYAYPGCPLVPFDKKAVIRWSWGVDLADATQILVPSVMAMYAMQHRTPAERFWHCISTGYAVHTDPYTALCSAICEVAERDSIELVWSQMLPLPLVQEELYTDKIWRLLEWFVQSFMRVLLFDATTDIGVPTVYALVIAEHNAQLMNSVSCATGPTISIAAEKAITDGVTLLRSPNPAEPAKREFRQFFDIEDGMLYTGIAEHAAAFQFLLDGCERRVPKPPAEIPGDSESRLWWLIDSLAAKGMQVVAVDRTTSELAAAGLVAYCAIIPDLQPMSILPLARFRAHPRLYSAPVAMGFRSLPEDELNPWPQPFA